MGADSSMDRALPAFFRQHGMPETKLALLPEHLNGFFPQVTPQPEITFIGEDLPFRMGNRIWLPVQTAGHAPGHLSFFHADSGVLLCGDAVLPQISPNVSLVPGSDAEPLALFLQVCAACGNCMSGRRIPDTATRSRISVNGSTRSSSITRSD